MPKRKAESDSEEEAQSSDASSETKPKRSSKKTAKKISSSREVGSSQKGFEDHASDKDVVRKNSEGDKYIDLGKKKRATVRAFKDIPLLDIREFYSAGSEEKPGKKGISLTLEQWQVLRTNSAAIDEFFAELSKGKK